jgi:hypothetical protein
VSSAHKILSHAHNIFGQSNLFNMRMLLGADGNNVFFLLLAILKENVCKCVLTG